MDYKQNNPVPLPAAGASESIHSEIDTIFDWQYALTDAKLLELYEKGKAATWNAVDLDWSIEVDLERTNRKNRADEFINGLLNPPRKLTLDEAVSYRVNATTFMLSQFLHGEQGALIASAKIVQTVPSQEAKFYAANQAADEARHVEVYHRYLTEKVGEAYAPHPSLVTLLSDIVSDSRWDITYLGMQILVEGLALAAFSTLKLSMPEEPLIQDITNRIMQDEARHVAFGVLALRNLYGQELLAHELREREDFVMEATALLRERLLMQPVFERLGWDQKPWIAWMKETPFNRGFRSMMFAKIVPNLKRLGLLTPRVREAFAQMDILKFENQADSVEEPGVLPSKEILDLLALAPTPRG